MVDSLYDEGGAATTNGKCIGVHRDFEGSSYSADIIRIYTGRERERNYGDCIRDRLRYGLCPLHDGIAAEGLVVKFSKKAEEQSEEKR